MKDELYHHGIKGQKWGVRRTPEELGHAPSGKRRSGSSSSGEQSKEARQKAYYLQERAKQLAEQKKVGAFRKKEREVARKKAARKAAEKAERAAKKEAKKNENLNKKKAEAAKDLGSLYKNRKLFSTQELNDHINRIAAEQRILDIKASQRSARLNRGLEYLQAVQPAITALSSAYDFYNKVQSSKDKEPKKPQLSSRVITYKQDGKTYTDTYGEKKKK